MPSFQAIAAMSKNRVIGDHGRIPWHLSEDFRWFKQKTMGGTLVMGRKTFESIGKPLPGRKTVVLSRTSHAIPNVTLYDSVEAFHMGEAMGANPIWICGGVEIYRQFLPQCSLLYLTCIKRVVEGDAFFPPFEEFYTRDQIIHETDQFRVERWISMAHLSARPQPESWPAQT